MPDPFLYFRSMAAAALAAAVFTAAAGGMAGSSDRRCGSFPPALGWGGGVIAGWLVLRLSIAWPPANALDRFAGILLPIVWMIELAAGATRLPCRVADALRAGWVVASGPILMHGSIYLHPEHGRGMLGERVLGLVLGGVGLAAAGVLLRRLSRRRETGVTLLLSLALATQTAGMLVMLAGYLKGGAAAFPLAAAAAGTALAAGILNRSANAEGALGLGFAGLYGIVFIGRFFGGLTTSAAAVVLAAPLLCWVPELPGLRHRPPRQAGLIRLACVAVPLLVLLFLAWRDFERDLRPLMNGAFHRHAVAGDRAGPPRAAAR